jgi:hypothetical protein
MAFLTLNVRLEADIKTALQKAAEDAGLSMKEMLEATIANAAGADHPHAARASRGWARHRKSARLSNGHPS